MNRFQSVCALLLSLPLVGSGMNFLLDVVPPPAGTGLRGEQVFELMRDGQLVPWLALGHFVTGTLLLLRRWRFVAGLLQLPVSVGILAFNVTLFPPGVALASAMLILNSLVVYDPERLRLLLRAPRVSALDARCCEGAPRGA